jgi:AraC family transcriptional regulator, transcriptional activator of pobA
VILNRFVCINFDEMTKPLYPTFDIHNLNANKLSDAILNVDRFEIYLSKNPHLQVVHRHSFYHLVYFTKGRGSHTIDFESFPVQEGMIYFMRPGQVHNWSFEGSITGYIINFSSLFFGRYLLGANLAEQFSFFNGNAPDQVMLLDVATQQEIKTLFETLLKEKEQALHLSPLMIASLMLQLFIKVERSSITIEQKDSGKTNYNALILRNFQQLIDTNFQTLKLPKDYAALLYITPSHLNALCREILGLSAGVIIRNRIILEAKRLLINFELSVNAIALELNFPDASYFVKFFKKYVGSTPEAFRKEHFSGHH